MSTALAALRAQFGEAQVISGEAALPFERDWRGQFPGRAFAVLCPRETAEVQAMLRWAAEYGFDIVPQGGNTGLVGGSTPDASGREIVLSLQRMRRVLEVSSSELSLRAEAGCPLASLQQAAAAYGLLLPLSLASEGSCTLGGVLATNAGGTQVLRWGNARELCLGLEVVGADGQLFSDQAGLRKDHRGLNLRDLFIGSEGLLGVITAATLKLAPMPRSRVAAWIAVPDLDAALQLLHGARRALGDFLSGFEVMGAEVQALLGARLPLPIAPWALLVELSSGLPETVLRQLFEEWLLDEQQPTQGGGWSDVAIAQSQAQFDAFWALREAIPAAQTAAGGNLKHDISLPIGRIPAFVAASAAAIARDFPGARPMVFGHLGDGNLHYNVAPPQGEALAAFRERAGEALTRQVFDAVALEGGSFSAEHGIGRLRREELAARADPAALAWMRGIKQLLDPANRLNPGRMLR